MSDIVDAHSLFRLDGDLLVPQEVARSLWKRDQMHGVATSGALARSAELHAHAIGRDDLQPTRFTVDLFRAPTMEPCQTVVEVLREGSRILVLDSTLMQDGSPVARSRTAFLKPDAEPDGSVWSHEDHPTPPPTHIAPISDDPRPPIFFSEGIGWSGDFAAHQNDDRKQMWQRALPVVVGETTSPFQCAAGSADATNMVANWGTVGVQHINTDITLSLSRLPIGVEIGLAALSRLSSDGIATATAIVYDRLGPIGTSTVTALANARRSIDFAHDATLREVGLVPADGA